MESKGYTLGSRRHYNTPNQSFLDKNGEPTDWGVRTNNHSIYKYLDSILISLSSINNSNSEQAIKNAMIFVCDIVSQIPEYAHFVTITKELKQKLLNEYKDVFVLIRWFEEAAALKAPKRGGAGVKDFAVNNKDPRYSMEIKILNKNFGQIRLYSVFETDAKGHLIKKDKNGNIIKNFVFTKLDNDHSKLGK